VPTPRIASNLDPTRNVAPPRQDASRGTCAAGARLSAATAAPQDRQADLPPGPVVFAPPAHERQKVRSRLAREARRPQVGRPVLRQSRQSVLAVGCHWRTDPARSITAFRHFGSSIRKRSCWPHHRKRHATGGKVGGASCSPDRDSPVRSSPSRLTPRTANQLRVQHVTEQA
jgi:hypothetical protein